jgi:hypothetical protein
VQPLQHHHEPSGHRRAVPHRQPLCRQPRADAGRIPGLFRTSDPQHRHRHRDCDHAVGHAAATAHRRAAGHQHPQHVIAALAHVAQAGEPLLGPGQQLRRVRAGAEPGDQKKRTWCGSRSTRTDRCSPSLASGRRSTVIAARSRSRCRGRIRCTAFSRHRRTRWSSRSIRRPCRSS